jgi:O-antigen ligase
VSHLLRNPGILAPLLYVFVAIIPHAIAPRYVLAGVMLLVLLYQLVRGQLQRPPIDLVTIGLIGVCAATVLSAAASPYYAESLPLLKKETLPFLVAFLLLVCQPLSSAQRQQCIRYAFAALILGFSVKLFLAIGDGIQHGWKFIIYDYPDQQKPRYLDFFTSDSHYYLPFLLTPLFFWPMKLPCRLFLGIVTLFTLLFALGTGVRATFIVTSFMLAIFLTIRFWAYKRWLLMILAVAVLGAVLAKPYVTHPKLKLYYELVTPKTYAFGTDGSITERGTIAKSVWEVNQDRYWLGYGPDWKKLPIVAATNGHLERWKNGSEPWHSWAYNYYMGHSFGQVNPHNFYLEVMFQVGALGLGLYLISLLAIAYRSLRICLAARRDVVERSAGLAFLIYIGVYLGTGISGGAWLPVTLLISAWVVELMRQQRVD